MWTSSGPGWSFPLGTDATGGVALVNRDRELEQAIRLILGTACGERPMRPEFGCRIHDHVFNTATSATAGQIAYDVRAALERWEPRIDVLDVAVSFAAMEAGTLYVDIRYQVRGLNDPRNLVFPFYVIPDHDTPLERAEPVAITGGVLMLPAPNLDDRHFQDLVDDAKRLVQQRCPSWTDHNVSDPGVTLIEAVAQMVDQLIYRLNRVPDLHYIKFLELIGVELRSSAAARGEVTFWLSAPQPQTVTVRPETQVATPRTDISDPVVFSTNRELAIVACAFGHAAVQPHQSPATDTTLSVGRGGFRAFSAVPVVGDSMLIGLTDAVPSCAILLRLDCTVSGRGVDPRRPPVVWEAWTDEGWAACELGSDDTGGLNKPGDVIIHVPPNHQTSVIAKERAGWLRCRLVQAQPDQPTYTESPTVISIAAHTIGGTAPMINAETIHVETVGRSDGTPGQRFRRCAADRWSPPTRR